jgi:aminoglycoside phosphotransferase (APT) family kinase protein
VSPLHLPPHVELPPAALRAALARHGLPAALAARAVRLPETGITNAVYALGDGLILRVPRDHPRHVACLRREALAVPAARAAGVRTPALVAFDDALDLLPVPYAVYERVPGTDLGRLALDPGDSPEAWRELGRDLALLHTRAAADGPAGRLDRDAGPPQPDPRELVERRVADGWLTALEARWLLRWLERLAPVALGDTGAPVRLLHGDTQPTNVMVASESLAYRAVIDWGDARWGDPASEFSGPPLRAVPLLLAGHREVAPLDGDETVEARVLWRHLHFGLLVLPRGAAPELSWAERPVPRLLEVLRFFLAAPDEHWTRLAPDRR